MYQDKLLNELIIDNFAGGGGASVGIERHIGKKYSEAKQIARLGNAVCPPVATALIRANCPELCYPKTLVTIVDLERAYQKSVV